MNRERRHRVHARLVRGMQAPPAASARGRGATRTPQHAARVLDDPTCIVQTSLARLDRRAHAEYRPEPGLETETRTRLVLVARELRARVGDPQKIEMGLRPRIPDLGRAEGLQVRATSAW